MLAIERRNMIMEKLQTERRVVVSELSRMFKVSEETIRRDSWSVWKRMALSLKAMAVPFLMRIIILIFLLMCVKTEMFQGNKKLQN